MRIVAIEEHFTLDAVERAMSGSHGAPGAVARANGSLAAQAASLSDLADQRLRDMDAAGISMQVLSLNAPATQNLDVTVAVPLARQANDALAEVVRAHPDRFAGFATLPTPEPAAAASELERAVITLGFKGAMIHGTTHGQFLDDPRFEPIFAMAQRLGVPLYLHPAEPPAAVRDAYYSGFAPMVSFLLSAAAWGWHVETGMHVLRLVLAGVFDRYPRLQLIIGHMGEALPFFLARASERLSPQVTGLPRGVQEYVQTHVQITTSGIFTVPPLLCALMVFGADRIMFAVDYPYSANEAGRAFLDAAPLSPADKEKLAHGNAERLLKL